MNSKQEHDNDLYYCSITLRPIFHPIFCSDGRYYELKALYEWLIDNYNNLSPITRKPVTTITYDSRLKNALDKLNLEDRHEPYEKDEYLEPLINKVNASFMPYRQHGYKSVTTINACLIFYACYLLFTNEEAVECNSSTLLIFMTSTLLTDYLARCMTNDRCSFFALVDMPTTYLVSYLNNLNDPNLPALIQNEVDDDEIKDCPQNKIP